MQHLDIAAAARAEGEIVAAHDVARAKPFSSTSVDEGVGRRGRRRPASKCCASTACTPYWSSSRGLAGGKVSRNGPVSGTKKRRGCGSKVSATTGALERGSLLGGTGQQRLVAAMHAVEIAQRHRPALPLRPGMDLPVVEASGSCSLRLRRAAAPARRPRRRSPPCRRSGTASSASRARRSWLMSVMVADRGDRVADR